MLKNVLSRGWLPVWAVSVLALASALLITQSSAEQVQLTLQKTSQTSSVKLNFEAKPASYRLIYRSTDLVHWELVDMTFEKTGAQTWTDPDQSTQKQCFYRIEDRPFNTPSDMDADGFDDVFEHSRKASGFSPMVANPNLVTVSAVTPTTTAVAAGALDSAPHQTEVTIQVTPPGSYPVMVWLQGGGGYGTGTTSHFTGAPINQSGPARISASGTTFAAGSDAAPSQRAMVVTTDASGRAVAVLTSSNLIGEQCTVCARAGNVPGEAAFQAQSAPVTFEQGTMSLAFPQSLTSGGDVTATASLTYKGQPLPGHDIALYVNRVRTSGVETVFTAANPAGLTTFAAVRSGDVRQFSSATGQNVASVYIAPNDSLEFVEVNVVDLQIFAP
jgi:hypothetical protein